MRPGGRGGLDAGPVGQEILALRRAPKSRSRDYADGADQVAPLLPVEMNLFGHGLSRMVQSKQETPQGCVPSVGASIVPVEARPVEASLFKTM